jgi:hypothetical protein
MITHGCDRRGGIFQPCWGATAPAAAAASQPFQGQDSLFNLFSLEPQLSEHFIHVQGRLPFCKTAQPVGDSRWIKPDKMCARFNLKAV